MAANENNGYRLVSAVFLRLLGGIYLIAFVSLSLQIEGLIGSQGIIPIGERLADYALNSGIDRYFRVPTLFWLNTSDLALTGATVVGCVAAVLIIFNIWSRPALIVAFLLYLSLFQASQPFLNSSGTACCWKPVFSPSS